MTLRVCKGYPWKRERRHSKDCAGAAYTEEDLEKFVNSKKSKYGKMNLCLHCKLEWQRRQPKEGWEERERKRQERLQALRACRGYPWEGERRYAKDCAVAAHTTAELVNFAKDKNRKYGRDSMCKNCKNEYSKKYAKKHPSSNYHTPIRMAALQKVADAHDLEAIQCFTCSQSDVRGLQIDHINDDGAQDRRRYTTNITGRVSKMTHAEIRDRLQILCGTCSMIKEFERRKRVRG